MITFDLGRLLGLLGLGIMFYFSFRSDINRFFRWLKGSRRNYYMKPHGSFLSTSSSLRSPYERSRLCTAIEPLVIEISRGVFRRRSAIYGNTANSWSIVRDWFDPILDALRGDWVSLADARGLPIKEALEVINRYPSFQAMLDRIAGLEQELKTANSIRQDYNAAIYVLLSIIQTDRQFYRSKSSEHIRECLEIIKEWQKHREPEPSSDKIMVWRKVLPPVGEMAKEK